MNLEILTTPSHVTSPQGREGTVFRDRKIVIAQEAKKAPRAKTQQIVHSRSGERVLIEGTCCNRIEGQSYLYYDDEEPFVPWSPLTDDHAFDGIYPPENIWEYLDNVTALCKYMAGDVANIVALYLLNSYTDLKFVTDEPKIMFLSVDECKQLVQETDLHVTLSMWEMKDTDAPPYIKGGVVAEVASHEGIDFTFDYKDFTQAWADKISEDCYLERDDATMIEIIHESNCCFKMYLISRDGVDPVFLGRIQRYHTIIPIGHDSVTGCQVCGHQPRHNIPVPGSWPTLKRQAWKDHDNVCEMFDIAYESWDDGVTVVDYASWDR